MDPSMNLTLHRGPSVWDSPRATPLHLAAAVAGVVTTALAWRAAPPHRFWIAGLAAAGATAALLAGRTGDRALAAVQARRRAHSHDALDSTLKDTFPASDAPAVW